MVEAQWNSSCSVSSRQRLNRRRRISSGGRENLIGSPEREMINWPSEPEWTPHHNGAPPNSIIRDVANCQCWFGRQLETVCCPFNSRSRSVCLAAILRVTFSGGFLWRDRTGSHLDSGSGQFKLDYPCEANFWRLARCWSALLVADDQSGFGLVRARAPTSCTGRACLPGRPIQKLAVDCWRLKEKQRDLPHRNGELDVLSIGIVAAANLAGREIESCDDGGNSPLRSSAHHRQIRFNGRAPRSHNDRARRA